MTAKQARAASSAPAGPRAGALAPSVTPASGVQAAPRTDSEAVLGAAQIDCAPEPEAQTFPNTLADSPLPAAVVADPELTDTEVPEDDASPFPTLETASEHELGDPLEVPPGFVAAPEGHRTVPPPLPEDSVSHLRLVDGSTAEPAEAPEPEAQPSEPAPASRPSTRSQSRVRGGSRPAFRAPSRTRATSGRAFGTNPPRGPTPPPVVDPALAAELDDWTPPLRREQSVLEEAEALRHRHLYKLKRLLGRLSDRDDRLGRGLEQARGMLTKARRGASKAGLRAASRVGDVSISALHRFEKLPRRRQVMWVAAPYAVALVLLGIFLATRGPSDEAPVAELVTPAAATAEAAAPPPNAPEAPAIEAEAVEPPAEAVALAAAAPAAPEPAVAEAAEAAPMTGQPVRLPRRSKLFVRADAKSRRPIRLRKGSALTVFEGFPSPEGWRLVQTKKGTVGFVSALHLANQPDPRVDKKRRRRRSRR